MCFLIWNAHLLEVDQEARWRLAKYSLLIEIYSMYILSRTLVRKQAAAQLSTGSMKATISAS